MPTTNYTIIRQSTVESLEEKLDEAATLGWRVVTMTYDPRNKEFVVILVRG